MNILFKDFPNNFKQLEQNKMMQAMDDEIDIKLVSTWLRPFSVTLVIMLFTFALLPHEREKSLTGTVSPVIALSFMVLLEFIPIVHPAIYQVSRWTGFIFVFWIFYAHLWDQVKWSYISGTAIFLLSIAAISFSFFLNKAYKKNTRFKAYLPIVQVIGITVFIIVPNTYSIIHELSLWEIILRVFVFTFTSWFNLITVVTFNDRVNVFEFFNRIWWVLIIHRYLIPVVGILWMNSVMKMTEFYSNKQEAESVTSEESQALIELEDERAKKPTTLFQTPLPDEISESGVAAPPRQRRMKKWNGGQAHRRSVHITQSTHQLSAREQLLKLQQMSTDVDAV